MSWWEHIFVNVKEPLHTFKLRDIGRFNKSQLLFYNFDNSIIMKNSIDNILPYLYPLSFKLPLCWLHSLTPVT